MRKGAFLLPLVFAAILSPARDKPQNWLQLQSPHFLVVTNGNEKQARHTAGQLERMRMVFHLQFPEMHIDPASPIVVIATKDEKDFRSLEPEEYLGKGQLQLAGLFLRAADKNYILLRLDAAGDHPYATVYHEYTHLITSKSEEWLPLWLNEGWAEFYQMTELRDKEALLGQPSPENILLLRQNHLLPLPTLLAVDRNSPYYHEENKGSIFYAESWVLTHYLTVKDVTQHTHLLTTYLQLLSQGTDSVTAATRAFGDLQTLQEALASYVSQSSFSYFKMPDSTQVDESAFKLQPLPPAQADAVRADFLAYNRRTTDARALLEEALKEDPDSASAHETMGFLEFQQHHLDEARKWYGQAVTFNSHSYLAHYYFSVITMRDGAVSADDDLEIESSLRTAIKLNPEFAPSYDALATFYGRRQRNLDEALVLSRKASELEPGEMNFQLNTANILLAMRRGQEAIAVLHHAVSLAKNPEEEARAEAFLQNAEQFEAARERAEQYNRSITPSGQSTGESSTSANSSETISEPPRLTRRTEGYPDSAEAGAAPSPKPHGPPRFVTGIIKNVRCSEPSALELTVIAGAREFRIHSDNYYKIQFSALGFTPSGEIQPCSQIEGKPAKVEFIPPTDTSMEGQIISIELHK